MARMHADEVATGTELVRRLLRQQFPRWAGLPVVAVPSSGTDHALFRLGDQLVARLPRIGRATAQAALEAHWLPELAPRLPLPVPVPVARGRPGEGYPFDWSLYEWLPGRDASAGLPDLDLAAGDLAGFVRALRAVGAAGAPPRSPGARGAPLAELDDEVRAAVEALGGRVEGTAVLRSWQRSLAAPVWRGGGVWVHGDLLPGNLLVRGGRLAAVIDFGTLAVGDPAVDLLPAWNLFRGSSRRRYLAELDADEATRLRGRGWALAQAVAALPYYWTTNPGMVRQAQHALAEVLAEE